MRHRGSLDAKPDASRAKVATVTFALNDFYEGLNRRIKAGTLKLTDLSTPTRLSLMYYDAAKRGAEALKETV
jgi:hypothetical protein